MYYLKYIARFDWIRLPGVVITTLINSFDTWFLKVFVIKVIVDSLLDSFDFHHILWMLTIAIGFKSLKLIYDSCWSYYTKRSDQRIIAGFQHIAFARAAGIDLQCYDDPDFYNDYVYSVQDSSSRPLSFINSISQLLQTIFTVSFSGLYVIFNDPILLVFAVIPILGDSFIRTKMNKVRAERTSLIVLESRKIDYVKRTSYLKEYAKLGYTCVGETMVDPIQNNTVAFLVCSDQMPKIELISPINRNSTIFNFRDGYHHICYDVSDDPDYLRQFKILKI